jgi:hypothetical protein
MSSTVDNINNNILGKIKELDKILTIYSSYELKDADNTLVVRSREQLIGLLDDYELGSLEVLKEYYTLTNTDIQKQIAYNKFIRYITNVGIIGKMKRIYTQCVKLNDVYETQDPVIGESLKAYSYTNIDLDVNSSQQELCSCGGSPVTEAKNSELLCKKCGKFEKLYGVVFEDDQFFYQEGQRTKHGKYDPTKHCKFWVDRIQARENAEIPENVINKVKRCIKRDSIWLEQLTCGLIRRYLKELKLTNYNDHVTLIRKLITGKEPPPLTDHELNLINIYFGRVISIYNKIIVDRGPNCPYHPFFIYKIIEQILDKPADIQRKIEILSCIHLQARETLIENDIIWSSICEQIPEFTYLPTKSS